jgi:hypothetical protein
MKESFAEWIIDQVNARGWSYSELFGLGCKGGFGVLGNGDLYPETWGVEGKN